MQRLSVKAKVVSLGHNDNAWSWNQYYIMDWPRIQQRSECGALG